MKRILVPILLLVSYRLWAAEAQEQIFTVTNGLKQKIIVSYASGNLTNARQTISVEPQETVTLRPSASTLPSKKYLHVKAPSKQKLGSFLLPPATTKYGKVIIADKNTPRGPEHDTSEWFDIGNSSGDELIFFQ